MSKPLVSICIPTFNGADFLSEAMESVLNQTYDNLEVIVSDDASTDDTLEIIKSYINKTNIPIHIFNHFRDGIGANWNNCIENARGTYIKFLFQDDLIEPNCIADMVQILQDNPKIGLVCCKRHVIIEDGQNKESTTRWIQVYGDLQSQLQLNYDPIGVIDKGFFKTNQFYKEPINVVGEPTAVMFPMELVSKIGYFSEDLTQCLDFEYWYRILKVRNIAVINKKLVSFRIHANQATQQNKGKMQSDVTIFNKLLYTNYFWLVNRSRQKQLFLKYHPIGKLIKKLG